MSNDTMIPTWTMQDRMTKALAFAGVGVTEMADELGVSRNTVGNYMHGRTTPNRATLRIWALRCGVPFTWLVEGTTDDSDTTAVTHRYLTEWLLNGQETFDFTSVENLSPAA
jgi:transcriptional regulator with XRE-family HTH domain